MKAALEVVERPDGFHVVSQDGSRYLGGPYRERSQALERRRFVDGSSAHEHVVSVRPFWGLRVAVENPAGSTRRWVDAEGRETGATLMRNDYGFIEEHLGSDGDELDCYLGPDEGAAFVYAIRQLKAPAFREYDEQKIMLGFPDEASAKAAWQAHRNDGDRAYDGMTAIPREKFLAKLARRTSTGPIRHERMAHGTITFDGAIPQPGQVAVGRWDRFTTTGPSVKGGDRTEFTDETAAQMIRNFVGRGVLVPMDWRHETYKAASTYGGQSLARYSALAWVRGGQVVQFGVLLGYEVAQPEAAGMGDGLWGYRCEVTPLGQQLLPNVRYISPAFTSEGVDEQEKPIGYVLQCVAATDVPFQGDRGDGAPEITFEQTGAGGATGGDRMNPKMEAAAKFVGLDGSADPKTIKQAYSARLAEARKCFEAEEDPDAKEMAKKYAKYASDLEDMAKLHEDASFEEEPGAEPDHVVMRRMAVKFRKMAKMAEPVAPVAPVHDEPDGDEPDAQMQQFAQSLGIDPKGKKRSVLMDAIQAATVPASKVAELAKIAARDALAQEREQAAAVDRKRKAQILMEALPSSVPAPNRAAIQRIAERDPEEAALLAQPFLPQTARPEHLFERVTQMGGPIGGPAGAGPREMPRAKGPRIIGRSTDAIVSVIADDELGEAIEQMADSKDATTMEKIDVQLAPNERGQKWARLVAAEKVLRAERPQLFEEDHQRSILMGL